MPPAGRHISLLFQKEPRVLISTFSVLSELWDYFDVEIERSNKYDN